MRCRLAEWRGPPGTRLAADCRRGAVFAAPRPTTSGAGFGVGGWVRYTHPAGGAFSPLRAVGYVFVGAKAAILSKTGFVLVPSEP